MRLCILVSLFTFFLIAMAARAEEAPLPAVQDFTYDGAGCPQGSATGTLEANGNFGIVFEKLEAFTSAERRRAVSHCSFSVTATPAPGWKMAIKRVLLDGLYEVSATGRGWLQTSYGMNGMEPFWARRTFAAGTRGDFNVNDGLAAYPWSRCGEPVTIEGSIELGALRGDAPSEYTEVIVQNGVVRNRQRVTWQWEYYRCDDDDDDGDDDDGHPRAFDGAWRSRYETEQGQVVEARLVLDGDHGTYDIGSAVGQLSQVRVDGDVARGRWRLGAYSGWFQFRKDGDSFTGTWGRGTNNHASGRWWGAR